MAKKLVKLTLLDIVLQADAETIREAYEARLKIDGLLVKREEAYRQVETLELQIEELIGEEGLFVYPEPPFPVAGFSKPVPASRSKPKPEMVEEPKDADPEEAPETPAEEPAIEESEKTETAPESNS